MKMYALTLLEPWATAVRDFGKRVENRSWPVPRHLMGEVIAIHAGVGMTEWRKFRDANNRSAWRRVLHPIMDLCAESPGPPRAGQIVATARIAGCLRPVERSGEVVWTPAAPYDTETCNNGSHSPWWYDGDFGHVFSNVVPVTVDVGPIRGKLGYWAITDMHVVDEILADRELNLTGRIPTILDNVEI